MSRFYRPSSDPKDREARARAALALQPNIPAALLSQQSGFSQSEAEAWLRLNRGNG